MAFLKFVSERGEIQSAIFFELNSSPQMQAHYPSALERDRKWLQLAAETGEKQDRLLRWAIKVAERRGVKVAAVALANELARVVWALLAHGRQYVPTWSKSVTKAA